MGVSFKEPPKYIETVNNKFLINWHMTHELFSEKPNPNVEISDSDYEHLGAFGN